MSGRYLAFISLATAAIAALLAAAAIFCLSAQREPPRLVFVAGGSGPYWQRAVAGARDAAATRGATLRVTMPESELKHGEQSGALRALLAEVPDGVVVCPQRPAAQGPLVDALAQRSHVVTLGQDAGLQRACFVGLGDFRVGRMCGSLVGEALPRGGKAVVLADSENAGMASRLEGLRKTLAKSCEIAGVIDDHGDAAVCVALVRETIAAHPDVACLVDLNSRPVSNVLNALEQAARGDVRLIAIDQSAETLAAIELGRVYAAVALDPYQAGYLGVSRLADYSSSSGLTWPQAGLGSILLPGIPVRQENLAEFRALIAASDQPAAARALHVLRDGGAELAALH
jgi:ABC-type sugar transport system substrate-binding protein